MCSGTVLSFRMPGCRSLHLRSILFSFAKTNLSMSSYFHTILCPRIVHHLRPDLRFRVATPSPCRYTSLGIFPFRNRHTVTVPVWRT